MFKAVMVVFLIMVYGWFGFCLTQPWSADVLILNLFSIVVVTGSTYVVFAEDL